MVGAISLSQRPQPFFWPVQFRKKGKTCHHLYASEEINSFTWCKVFAVVSKTLAAQQLRQRAYVGLAASELGSGVGGRTGMPASLPGIYS